MNENKAPNPAVEAAAQPPGNVNGDSDTTRQTRSSQQPHGDDITVADNKNRKRSASGGNGNAPNGNNDDDAASEAETLITSPVKKREAAKQQQNNAIVKTEKPLRSRIGGLPVPGEDDEDSVASPMPSTEVSVVGKEATTSNDDDDDAPGEDVEMADNNDDQQQEENGSDLSSARSTPSRGSSRSRAVSERPGASNPRKRKYRASSVGLPDHKRQSMEPPRAARKIRAMHSEGRRQSSERSASPPKGRHRRTISIHSAMEGTVEVGSRSRRAVTQFPVRDTKSVKTEWAESDASSETTSRGGDESKRPQRHVGRSTSTPGRPFQREHKRHVNKYGFTRLAEACENGDVDLVKEWRVKDPDQVELAEFAGNKPLQIAALNGNSEVVAYLIQEGCQIDCANADKDTPLIDAAENGHLEVVKLLLDAGVDPLRQNMKGQQALDVVTDDVDDAKQIRAALRDAIDRWNSDDAKQRREEEETQRQHRGGPSKELHFMARTYENLLKLVTINDRAGVQEFLDARVPVDNAVIAAAAKTGDSYLLSMLLAEMTTKKAFQKPEKPMLAVLGTSHFEMVKLLTELDQFNPLWVSRQGKTWPEIAEERNGPMWRQELELLRKLYDQHAGSKARRSSSPVSKRDANGKRRLAAHRQVSDDSDEDNDDENDNANDTASAAVRGKRKNGGRRLMSRGAMRAASGKAQASQSSEEEEEEEEEDVSSDSASPPPAKGETDESAMPPPDTSPHTRRAAAGRTRSQSASSQPPDSSPRTRRRSISLREKSAQPGAGGPDAKAGSAREAGETQAKKQKRKDEADAQAKAKAKKAAEDAKRAEEERQVEEQRKAEEQKRLAEEQRLAEEEARRKAEEEEAAAEAARKAAEEERLAKERELEAAKQRSRAEALACLPLSLKEILDPESSFALDGPAVTPVDAESAAAFVVRHFTPLRPVHADNSGAPSEPADSEVDWILNLQAAPLLGKRGLELFLRKDSPCFSGSLAEELESTDLAPASQHVIDQILAALPLNASLVEEHEETAVPESGNGALDAEERERRFQAFLARSAELRNAFRSARRRLTASSDNDSDGPSSCPAVIRCFRLTDVIRLLHPTFHSREIALTGRMARKLGSESPGNDVPQNGPFFDRLASRLAENRPPCVARRLSDGGMQVRPVASTSSAGGGGGGRSWESGAGKRGGIVVRGWQEVRVVHQK